MKNMDKKRKILIIIIAVILLILISIILFAINRPKNKGNIRNNYNMSNEEKELNGTNEYTSDKLRKNTANISLYNKYEVIL